MKKINKKILVGFFLTLFIFLLKLPSVTAAGVINVSAPSLVVVGQTFKVSVSVPSSAGSWDYTLSYDSSKVKLVSGQLKVLGITGDDSKTNTYTFKALKSGTATFKPVNANIADYKTNDEYKPDTRAATVTMKTQAEIEASYSRNNNLSSLSIEGAELSPAFSADTLEYTATLPIDTEKAVINAVAADNNATIEGTGEITVQDGINKIEVIVTAQHGEKKTYVINLTVLELDPIKVKINNSEYSIVRKKGQIQDIPSGFEETTVKIEDQEVAAYKSDLAKLTLVGLKDNSGNIDLYIYENKKFIQFNEDTTSSLNLIIFNDVDVSIPKGFSKEIIKINKKDVTAFTFTKKRNSNYYLVYAMDLSNGKKEFYLYDKENGSYQRYYNELTEYKDLEISVRDYIILGFLGVLTVLIIIVIARSLTKKEKKINRYQKKINKLSGKPFEKEEEQVAVEVKKIEEDEFTIAKKSRKQRAKELEEAKRKLDSKKDKIRRVSLEDEFDD